jgi:hypothetical protein
MDIDRFWQLIEQARVAAGPAANQATRDIDDLDDEDVAGDWDFDDDVLRRLVESGRGESLPGAELDDDDEDDDGAEEDDLTDPIAVGLFEQLIKLPAAEIADFDNTFEDLRAQADIPKVIAAATLIEHGLHTSDTFDDFRAGLVALGRATYEAALVDADSLADHPVVREIAQTSEPRWFGREDVLFVASHAYAEVTGEDAVTFFDYAEGLREAPVVYPDPNAELELINIEREAEVRAELPRLADMFLERALRNRARAEDSYRESLSG